MREFTDDDYGRIETLNHDELDKLIDKVDSSPWRQGYHIQPVTGYMASPAAFFSYEGKYHLFYNWHPTGSCNGINYWYHVTSTDLVTFENRGVKLRPDDLFDHQGLTSGSALLFDHSLYVFYTGFFKKTEENIIPVQLAAQLNKNDKLIKHPLPLIETVPGNVKSVAHPFVFKNGAEYYMLLGSETREGYGGIAVYKTVDNMNFNYLGLLETELDTFGDVWNHPSLFQLDGYDVLTFCLEGVDKFGFNFWNVHQAGFVIGEFDSEDLIMNHGTFFEFDYGFDFYAPMTTVDFEGRRVMIGLLGMHETSYPTDQYGWAHCLSIPRVLSIENYKLKQRPHPNLKYLRESTLSAEGYFQHYPKRMKDFYGDKYEFNVNFIDYDATEIYIKLRVSKREETVIIYNTEHNEVTLDTTFSGDMPGGVDGTERKLKLQRNLEQLRIFMDVSSIEVFINDGDRVMSARIFPSEEAIGVELSTEIGECHVEMTQYKLKESEHEKIIYSWRSTD